jgi:hypothetical protein
VQFEPSKHSLHYSLQLRVVKAGPEEVGGSYEGWFANLFTRTGRAENKRKRARRKAKRGNKRAATRLRQRAAVLEAKAEGKSMLAPDERAGKLWRVKEPWATRKRRLGGGLDAVARGNRPSNEGQRGHERRGTVVGAILALQAAGIEPWAGVKLKKFINKGYIPPERDTALLSLVRKTSGQDGKKLKTMRKAAEYMRGLVIQKKLGGAAWNARAAMILGTTLKRTDKSSKGVGATSSALGAASAGMLATMWGPQVVVFLPGAIIAGIASVGTAIAAAPLSITKTRATSDIEKYMARFSQAIERSGYRMQISEAQVMLHQAELINAYQSEIAGRVKEAQVEEYAEAFKVVSISGGIAVSLIGLALAVKVIRRNR